MHTKGRKLLTLLARSDLLKSSLDVILGVGEDYIIVDVGVVFFVVVVVVGVGVVYRGEGRLVGVHGAVLVDENSELNTISVRAAHGSRVQVHTVPLLTSLLALSELSDPLGNLVVDLVLALDVVIKILLINEALVGLALVTVDVVLVVGKLTLDLLGVLALGLLQLTAIFPLSFALLSFALALLLVLLLITGLLAFFLGLLSLFYVV